MGVFLLGSDVYEKAKALGIDGAKIDVIRAVEQMFKHSAPYSGPEGNRRYREFALTCTQNKVTDIARIARLRDITQHFKCDKCDDTGIVQVYNECEVCWGHGCDHCDGQGLIPGSITCPACKAGLNERRQSARMGHHQHAAKRRR